MEIMRLARIKKIGVIFFGGLGVVSVIVFFGDW